MTTQILTANALDAALEALDLGLHPIPVEPGGKTPLVEWKDYQDTRPTEAEVEQWWSKWPDANVAILTGTPGGVTVIDFDVGHGDWPGSGHELPTAYVVATPGAGQHYYLAAIPGVCNSAGKLAEHVDVRGEGGYVLVPPSMVNGKPYVPLVGSLSEALKCQPDKWLVEELTAKAGRAPGLDSPIKQLLEGVEQGRRNDSAARIAGHYLRLGYDPDAVSAVLKDWNAHNKPPLPIKELEAVVDSIARAELAKREAGTIDDELLTHCTEAGNAEVLAYLYGNALRYDHKQNRWLVWKGHWWGEDVDGEVKRLAKQAARARYHCAERIAHSEEFKRVSKWAVSSESRQRLEAAIALAKAEPPIADEGKNWDSDPYLLGLANGVLDLHTGKLREGKPEDRITKHIDVAYDPEARCPRWCQFVDEICDGDASLIDYMWKAVGYSLTGDTSEQVFFILYGKGANGKTTFLESLLYLFGPYGHNTDMETFLTSRYGSSHPTELAELAGKRLVVATEPNKGRRLNEARLKALAGQDKRRARFLYQRGFSWEPTEKVWLAVNDKPTVRDPSDGFWRKVQLIPFQRQFKGNEADNRLREKLKTEVQGILRWAVEGCLAWQKEGLKPPEKVIAATQEYRRESDLVATFLDEKCVLNAEAWTPSADLQEALTEWQKETGEHLSSQDLRTGLRERGCGSERKSHNSKVTRGWAGVGLFDQWNTF